MYTIPNFSDLPKPARGSLAFFKSFCDLTLLPFPISLPASCLYMLCAPGLLNHMQQWKSHCFESSYVCMCCLICLHCLSLLSLLHNLVFFFFFCKAQHHCNPWPFGASWLVFPFVTLQCFEHESIMLSLTLLKVFACHLHYTVSWKCIIFLFTHVFFIRLMRYFT